MKGLISTMKKNSVRKIIACLMATAMLTGAGVSTSAGTLMGINTVVSAASSDYEYWEYDDGLRLSGYNGNSENVVIPETIDGKKVVYIGDGAFFNNDSIKTVTIPSSVSEISRMAFWGCNNLTTINVSTGNKYYASENGLLLNKSKTYLDICPKGKSGKLVLPKTVRSIRTDSYSDDCGAFDGCEKLTSIVFPEGMQTLGRRALEECTNLTSVSLPSTFMFPDSYVEDYYEGITAPECFAYNNKLKTISVNANNPYIKSVNGVLYSKDGKKLIFCPRSKSGSFTVPSGVTTIGASAFSYCTALTSVTLPDTVVTIDEYAFDSCEGLTSFTMTNSVTTINESAFAGCGRLNDLTISSNIEYLGPYALNGVLWLDNQPDGLLYIGKTALYKGDMPDNTTITIKAGTKALADHAFAGCQGLVSIKLPSGLKTIGGDAFLYCSNLTTVNIPSSVTEIGNSAFSGCSSIRSMTLPKGITRINAYTFSSCESLEKVNIPANVTYIGRCAFLYCKALTSVTLPFGLETLDAYAFEDCTSLKSVEIPDSVTWLGQAPFCGCTALENVVLPDRNVQLYHTFADCTNLKKAIVPSGIQYYVSSAFEGCKDFTVYGEPGSVAEQYAANPYNIQYYGTSFEPIWMNNSALSQENITIGKSVTVNMKVTEGTNCTYSVYYRKKADTAWTTALTNSTKTAVTIKPAEAGDYDVCVKAKDSSGTIRKKYLSLSVCNKLANTSTINLTTVQHGGMVVLSCAATGGSGNKEYAVYYKKSSSTKWTTRQSYSENTEVVISPRQTGDYDICVKVKDETGSVVKKHFTVTSQ